MIATIIKKTIACVLVFEASVLAVLLWVFLYNVPPRLDAIIESGDVGKLLQIAATGAVFMVCCVIVYCCLRYVFVNKSKRFVLVVASISFFILVFGGGGKLLGVEDYSDLEIYKAVGLGFAALLSSWGFVKWWRWSDDSA